MSVELKYGVPGVLVTSGIALLALSTINAALFSVGISLLLLGILGFIVRQIFHDLDQINPDEMEPGGKALFVLYVINADFLPSSCSCCSGRCCHCEDEGGGGNLGQNDVMARARRVLTMRVPSAAAWSTMP